MRVVFDWQGDAPGELIEIVAAVGLGGYVFERSLVPRDGDEIVRGALRLGKIAWRHLIPDFAALSESERNAAEYDYSDSSLEQVSAALALHASGLPEPSYRLTRRAAPLLSRNAVRAALEPLLTSPELGTAVFEGWGRQLAAWGLAAGPLDSRGSVRELHDSTGFDDLTPARRRLRDRSRKLPTEPRKLGPPA